MELYKNITAPVASVVKRIGEWAVNKIIPPEIFDDFVQNTQARGAEKTMQLFEYKDLEE